MGYIPALQAVDWMKKCRNRHKPFKPIDHGKLRETRILSGLNKKEAAEMLHVTYRTWHNWESGRVQVPYAAYKLLRILTGLTFQESPGGAGVYLGISPKGKNFTASDLGYLSLTLAMARQWRLDREEKRSSGLRPKTSNLVPFVRPAKEGKNISSNGK